MKRPAPAACVLAALLLCFAGARPGQATAAAAPVDHYVRKYRAVRIPADALRRLRRYDHLVEYFCSFAYVQPRHKVNPDFLRALILAESNANPRALSKKGARGLTQLLYPTAKKAAADLAASRVHFRYVSKRTLRHLRPKDLYDPAVNILIACYLVATYNHRFHGRLDLVVAAWNAGEHSLAGGRVPPYPETRNLIGKVNGYYLSLLRMRRQRRFARD